MLSNKNGTNCKLSKMGDIVWVRDSASLPWEESRFIDSTVESATPNFVRALSYNGEILCRNYIRTDSPYKQNQEAIELVMKVGKLTNTPIPAIITALTGVAWDEKVADALKNFDTMRNMRNEITGE